MGRKAMLLLGCLHTHWCGRSAQRHTFRQVSPDPFGPIQLPGVSAWLACLNSHLQSTRARSLALAESFSVSSPPLFVRLNAGLLAMVGLKCALGGAAVFRLPRSHRRPFQAKRSLVIITWFSAILPVLAPNTRLMASDHEPARMTEERIVTAVYKLGGQVTRDTGVEAHPVVGVDLSRTAFSDIGLLRGL